MQVFEGYLPRFDFPPECFLFCFIFCNRNVTNHYLNAPNVSDGVIVVCFL